MQTRTRIAGLALVVTAVISLVACGSKSGSDSSAAAAAASSFTANPTVSADVTRLENELTANFQKDFSAVHPIASVKKAVTDTFPGGSASQIATYAAHHFTPAAAHKGPARQKLIQDTVTYALSLGAQPSASPSATASSPSASAPPSTTPASPGASAKSSGTAG